MKRKSPSPTIGGMIDHFKNKNEKRLKNKHK
jgi:hypothetical protein